MKRILTLAVSAIFILWSALPTDACTNLIVGKKASVDGSVICTYNCDGFGFASSLPFAAPGRHAAGEMIAIRSWVPGSPQVHYIPQAEYTYSVAGLMNEKQVSIVETTWGGRKELRNPEGWLGYFNIMELALQRAATAREAIAVMHQLVQDYGYNDTGESFAVCDKNEAWIMELIGKGPGRKGGVWVARRLPDDCITAYANASRIRKFPQAAKPDKKLGFCITADGECMYSADVISFAREMGYYTGPDKDFSFREAYGPLDFGAIRFCEARVWSFFRHHYNKEVMDSYLPFINGDTSKIDELPLWIKPDAPVSYRDIQNDMRDHYEGTALDMTVDVSAGPWASPYRNQLTRFDGPNGEKMFRERPIGCQQSGMTLVCRMRSWLPDAVGGITYFNLDDASMVAYVPVYCSINRIPDPFRKENNNILEFSTQSAFWMNNFVANMVYPRYSAMIGDLKEAQKELEDYYESDQTAVEAHVKDLTAGETADYLTGKTIEYTDKMMKRWDKLARLLIVKHNDQIMRPSKDGEVVPGRHTSPAYAPAFIAAVKDLTGSRYVNPEQKEAISADFVNITDVIPDVILEIRYHSTYNFVGARIDGYKEPTAILTRAAAAALKEVSDDLKAQGYRLKIFDAYRPQCAVDHFMRWGANVSDTLMKKYFYPMLTKDVLFPRGYIAEHSGHTRGSTVDLTIFDMNTEREVDMGGTFDWFGEESHPDYGGNPETGEYIPGKKITEQQFRNRMILRKAMLAHGFKPLAEEWWHFTLKDEPYPDTYFTFPVERLR